MENSEQDITSLGELPPEWQESLLPHIREKFAKADYKIVVLDDDPTGTQTVQNLPVLTHWSIEAIEAELLGEFPAFFILTNSRAMDEPEAIKLAEEIGRNILKAGQNSGVRTLVISRSDSTLRGHFPAEVDANGAAMGKGELPYLIIPFFFEGGRYTINDIHYVQEQDKLVPAAQTPFARDAVFGFTHSNLTNWVEEKSGGRIKAEDVHSISLNDIRQGGPEKVAERLRGVSPGSACIVNSASYRDMEVVVGGLQQVEEEGREFLYRTAASFVRTRTGMAPDEGLLTKNELVSDSDCGGLFVIGSYVEKTTQQLDQLILENNITPVTIDVENLLNRNTRDQEIFHIAEVTNDVLQLGRDCALYTSRKLITAENSSANLEIGSIISQSLVRILKKIPIQPRYLLAKGGITSSDVATEALGVRRAMVLGQAMPGVPVWKLGEETRFPGMSYIIFPGNVGDKDSLLKIRDMLS